MNHQAPLTNQIEVIEGNIRMYLILLVIILAWGAIEAYRVTREESNPVNIEAIKNPEAATPGHVHQ